MGNGLNTFILVLPAGMKMNISPVKYFLRERESGCSDSSASLFGDINTKGNV